MKKAAITLLKVVITLGLIWLVYTNLAAGEQDFSLDAVMARVLAVPAWYWVGLTLGIGVSYWLSAFQWWVLLRRMSVPIALRAAVRYYFIGLFFNNFLIGNVGGDLKKVVDIRRDAGSWAGGVGATLFDRIFGLFAINALSLIAWGLWFRHNPAVDEIVLPSLGIFLGMAVFFCALFSRRLMFWVSKVLQRCWLGRLADVLHKIHLTFQSLRQPLFLAKLLALSLTIQTLRIAAQWLIGVSLGIELDLTWYLFFIPLIGIVTALPISIGGFGPRELLAQNLFARAGVEPLLAILVQFVAYLLSLLVSLWGGLEFILGRGRKSKGDLDGE